MLTNKVKEGRIKLGKVSLCLEPRIQIKLKLNSQINPKIQNCTFFQTDWPNPNNHFLQMTNHFLTTLSLHQTYLYTREKGFCYTNEIICWNRDDENILLQQQNV